MKNKPLVTIEPTIGAVFGVLEMLKDATSAPLGRKGALTTELPTHLVDTCAPRDTNTWETGIRPLGKAWVIVEQYPDQEAAQAGHLAWVERLTTNPEMVLEDIDIYQLGGGRRHRVRA